MDLRQGVSAAAQAGEAGSFFQYSLSLPVSLARQESAMLPIVGQDIEGRRVSIYSERTQPKHPMHGLKLKNTTGLTLMGGPITLFEAGSYAGDAQIDSLPAGAERLVSFALDLETEVAPAARSVPDRLVAVRIARGVLTSTVTYRREKAYTAKVRGPPRPGAAHRAPGEPGLDPGGAQAGARSARATCTASWCACRSAAPRSCWWPRSARQSRPWPSPT